MMTASGVMTIFVYKGLARSQIISSEMTRLGIVQYLEMGQIRDTKFDKNVSNKILLNSKVTASILYQLLRKNEQGSGKIIPST